MRYSTHHQPMQKIIDRGKTVERSAPLRKVGQFHTLKDVCTANIILYFFNDRWSQNFFK